MKKISNRSKRPRYPLPGYLCTVVIGSGLMVAYKDRPPAGSAERLYRLDHAGGAACHDGKAACPDAR